MSSWEWWVALPLAAGGTAVSVYAGSNLAIAIPAAILAVLAVLLLAWTAIERRTQYRPRDVPIIETDSLARIRSAFHTGPLGRSFVVAELDGVDRSLRRSNATSVSLEAERRLLDASEDEFRRYVGARLEELEQDS